jgi:aminoglycoside phosphotransferase (APT) family kinase protein
VKAATEEEVLAAGVAEALAEAGEPSGEIRLTRIPGGASRETWLVESGAASDRDTPGREAEEVARISYVIRRDPPGSESLVPQRAEAELIGLAQAAGAAVPDVLRYEPPGGRFGTAGMLMRHIEGESVAPRLLRKPEFATARERLPLQLAESLARIHSVAIADLPEELGEPPSDPALAQIEVWEATLDQIGEPLPACEAGLRWLRANAPEPAAPALAHGDFRLGNFIVDGDGLAAVIDWELAHVSDPAEDIGWICVRSWRFGADDRPLAGVGDLDVFLAAYQEAGGAAIDLARIRYWEVFGNLKWAVICARQADDHRSGRRRSHELASLGRRICEPEWDLLELIK